MSTGWNCLLRKVDCRNESNGGTWHVVANGGRGANNGFHGGNPLQVANCFDNVDWHGIWEWDEMGWWTVETAVAVTAFIPGGSCGGADG